MGWTEFRVSGCVAHSNVDNWWYGPNGNVSPFPLTILPPVEEVDEPTAIIDEPTAVIEEG